LKRIKNAPEHRSSGVQGANQRLSYAYISYNNINRQKIIITTKTIIIIISAKTKQGDDDMQDNKATHKEQTPIYMGISEAAALLGVSASTIKRWCDEKKLTAIFTLGSQRRIPRAEIDRLLNATEEVIAGRAERAARQTGNARIALAKKRDSLPKAPYTKKDEVSLNCNKNKFEASSKSNNTNKQSLQESLATYASEDDFVFEFAGVQPIIGEVGFEEWIERSNIIREIYTNAEDADSDDDIREKIKKALDEKRVNADI